jgi:hypothetical protein
LTYSVPSPLDVKWNRLLNSVVMISAVFSQKIELLYLFLGLNLLTLLVTMHYGPTRWLLRLVEKWVVRWLDVPQAYARSYAMTAATERFEVFLRIVAVSLAIAVYGCCPLLTWLTAIGMGIFMLISTFFGFCLSALGFIAMRHVKERCRVRR